MSTGYDYPHLGINLDKFTKTIVPAHLRHDQVEDYERNVRLMLLVNIQRFSSVSRRKHPVPRFG